MLGSCPIVSALAPQHRLCLFRNQIHFGTPRCQQKSARRDDSVNIQKEKKNNFLAVFSKFSLRWWEGGVRVTKRALSISVFLFLFLDWTFVSKDDDPFLTAWVRRLCLQYYVPAESPDAVPVVWWLFVIMELQYPSGLASALESDPI